LELLVEELSVSKGIKVRQAFSRLGVRGRILDVNAVQATSRIADDTKSMLYVSQAIKMGLRCPICDGLLDPTKSVSYDHKIARRKGGTGDISNAQMAHPYCNSDKERIQAAIGSQP
jgi:5-methylcytosine-specific restriction endonuclease McrA